jgi:serine/threonine protein kinase
MSASSLKQWPGDVTEDFEVVDIIGKGQYGAVYRAREKSNGRLVALKKVATRGNESARRDIEFEASVLQLCAKSAFVVSFFGVWCNAESDDFWVRCEITIVLLSITTDSRVESPIAQ